MATRRGRTSRHWLRRFFSILGPGLTSGAADDDPSGISTYSIAGAQFGLATLWTALLTIPLMISVQLMCARVGMVTGRGLAGVIRTQHPKWVLWMACLLLIVANVVNIAADLAGMAETTGMITGVNAYFFTPLYTALMVGLLFWSSYRRIANILKWLALVLFAYVVAAFLSHPNWAAVLRFTVVPHIVLSSGYLATLVAIFGTTISPYLFFWQAAQEVEEDKGKGRTTLKQRRGATDKELSNSEIDVVTGMLFSNLIMFFIILTTATTLNTHGKTAIVSARQAAEALRPLAGDGAYWLFALGIIGTGLLSVPVLAGSTAYAIAEGAGWRHSLESKPRSAPRFYGVLGFAMLLGLVLNYLHFDAMAMLFWSAVVNGVLAPPLIVLVVVLTSDRKVMGDRVSSPLLHGLGWATAVVMTLAAGAMLVALL
jgi:NRAMP (natural resistance-associated macrophage protein)-like metal ion transporter